MATAKLLITGHAPMPFEFEPGKTFRQMCLDAREDENHPMRKLYEYAKGIGWTTIRSSRSMTGIDVDTFALEDGDAIFVTPRTTGCGGGKKGFVQEMTGRIRADLANPFITDEERARFELRNDEKVWERFWDESNGNPPCTYSLDSVKPKAENVDA